MHDSAYHDCARFRDKYLDRAQSLKIADIGAYDVNGCLRPLFQEPGVWDYTGFDIEAGPNVDVLLHGEYGWSQPYREQYDVVVTTQVMEHVRKPWEWIKDVVAVCKPGGLVYICTPNTIKFHEFPIDCWRAWPDGMRGLMDGHVREILECYAAATDPTGIGDTTGIGRK